LINLYYWRCIRTQQWEATKVWSSRNVTAESVVDEHKVAATITALKKLEGLLIVYGKSGWIFEYYVLCVCL